MHFDADDLLSEFPTHVLRQSVMGATKMTRKVRIFFSSLPDVFELKIIVEKIIAFAIDKKPENFEMDQLQKKTSPKSQPKEVPTVKNDGDSVNRDVKQSINDL